ncbi:metal ABC transporter permease [Fervidibacillus halotolerans]|uniref:Metal ABC transporter permease n=1 Tax=Fervidibacillus halotolerans TaxID=2980027 RepID=A0A9E8LZU0_9BACI|nr:iron chelate uptake ABC transporter family permease subunit [Fervidibacillus halotolerans]WAA12747.1 metal ABC transporter permease [Fervidibacillus halotolerans]
MSVLTSSNYLWVLFSTLLLGVASGLVGSLVYWKKQSLMSDALSHAALPGVAIAFLLFQVKDFFILIIGAALSALLGAFFIMAIKEKTRIKEDTAMGMILAVFFGGGIVLLTLVNRYSSGNQAGLDSFIYGQAASMVESDVKIMSALAIGVILIVMAGFKEWKLFLFDPDFGKGLKLPITALNTIYLFLLVVTIVIGIQAVGVILMSALLIIPPVAARYWTHSFRNMLLLSGFFGGISGAIGTTLSAFGDGWPTGAFIVLISGIIFTFSMFFGSKKGMVVEFTILRSKKKELQSYSVKGGRG